MPFIIVQTVEKNKYTLSTVPSGWESDNILRYPKKALSKYVRNKESIPQPDWDIMKCKVKRRNIASYEVGEITISEMVKHTDTTDDDNNHDLDLADQDHGYYHQRRAHHIQPPNLNLVAEKMMGSVESTDNYAAVNEFIFQPVPYLEKTHVNLVNATITSQNVSDDIYEVNVPCEDIGATTITPQKSVTFDIHRIFENQKKIMDNQELILKNMAKTNKKLEDTMDIVIKKIADFSSQIDDAVKQITVCTEVTNLNDCKGLDNTPFCIKPIDSILKLDDLENQLTQKNVRQNLKNTYSLICSGGIGVDCAYTLVDIMFTREFICKCSWSGGSRGENLKIPLKGYKHTLSFFWEMVNFWDAKYTLKDNETFFKTILKNSSKRKLAKRERASTSRHRSKRTKSSQEQKNESREMLEEDDAGNTGNTGKSESEEEETLC